MVEKGRVAFPKSEFFWGGLSMMIMMVGYGESSVGALGTAGKPLYHEADYPEHPRPYHWRDMQVSIVGRKPLMRSEKESLSAHTGSFLCVSKDVGCRVDRMVRV